MMELMVNLQLIKLKPREERNIPGLTMREKSGYTKLQRTELGPKV